VTGKTLGQNIDAAAPGWKQDVVRPLKNPIFKAGGIAVLRGQPRRPAAPSSSRRRRAPN